ncbi:MAG: pyruvate kinase [Planctomycetes bacterium]|nr:pyruvate kinase [Planctomycetota bacterium]
MKRRTRIVATLGPATDRSGVLEALVKQGLDVARINFSHGFAEEPQHRIRRLRALAREHGKSIAVLGDLPGPKLRALLPAELVLQAGQHLTIATRAGASADIAITEPESLANAKPGDRVLMDDGRLQAVVDSITSTTVCIVMWTGGTLFPNKGINLPDTDLAIPAITQRDRDALAVAIREGIDWLALSFVRDPIAADALRAVLREADVSLPIIAKIERPEAVAKSIDIINAFDGIMVARGDLGVEIALEKVPRVQKQLILQARHAGKPVITATDMLDSMRKNPRPTRAEVSDVANAVYDGTDAVMLSGETAAGDYPVEAFSAMDGILQEYDAAETGSTPRHVPVPRGTLIDRLTHDLCDLANEINASAIITPTTTGRTARLIARHRPRAGIVGVTFDEGAARQLSVVWGVQGVAMQSPVERGDDRMEAAVRAAYLHGDVVPGDIAVVLAGHPIEGAEGFPTIRVVRVGENGRSCEP